MAGKPKPAFFAAVALVIVGLVLFALYRADILAPKGDQGKSRPAEGHRSVPDRDWAERLRTRRTPPR